MVSFKDYVIQGQQVLTIADDKGGPSEALHLPIFNPAIGALSLVRSAITHPTHLTRWTLTTTRELYDPDDSTTISSTFLLSSLHDNEKNSEHFSLLGQQIDNGQAIWKASLSSFGEFSYIDGYWEWLEDTLGRYGKTLYLAKIYGAVYASSFTYDRDSNLIRSFCKLWCSSTNTLLTTIGELSISLWDLRELGGLPIHGTFYDEVVPSTKELTEADKDKKLFLPPACKYLFMAYHKLSCEDETRRVTAEDWVKFWFRGDSRYKRPSARVEKDRANKPRKSNNPTKTIEKPPPRSEKEDGASYELSIKEHTREETYLAAFLSCWLCTFVLPHKEANLIRPSVFKVASRMAHGERFSLAVPVLASIYRGLREISTSSNPDECGATFPIHYIYGWLGHYFKQTYFADRRFHHGAQMVRLAGEKMARHFKPVEAYDLLNSIDSSVLSSLSMSKQNDFNLVDDEGCSSSWLEYIIALRSSFLTLRHGNEFTIESYCPHRFARQFNFCQDIPGELKEEVSAATLKEVVQLWQSCMKMNTKSELRIPACSLKGLATKRYIEWWTTQLSSSPERENESLMEQPKSKSQAKAQSRKRKEEASSQPKLAINEARRTSKKAKQNNEVNLPSSKSKSKDMNKAPAKETTRTSQKREDSKEAPTKAKKCNDDKVLTSENKIRLKIGTTKLPSIVVKNPTPNKDEGQAESIPEPEDEVSSSREDRHWKRPRKKASISDLDKAEYDLDSILEGVPTSMPLEDFGEQVSFKLLLFSLFNII